jgi:hypothetical protein
MTHVHFAQTHEEIGLTEQWARQWEDLMINEWEATRTSYRLRIAEYWQAEFEQSPSAFSMVQPCEIAIVATLLRYWVLVRPSETDQLRLLAQWEDEQLDSWESLAMPPEVILRQVIDRFLDGGDGWTDVEFGFLHGHTMGASIPFRYHDIDPGFVLADSDADGAKLLDALIAMDGTRIDQRDLAVARLNLAKISEIKSAQRRGRALEGLLASALAAHGCEVELGRTYEGEQIDVFIKKPHVAIVEVRWTKNPQQTGAISVLTRKAQRRPPIFAGLFVSMSGFSRGARDAARDARDRAIFLMDKTDIETLFSGTNHFSEFWQDRVDEALRRY